jgi:hypothetical protein
MALWPLVTRSGRGEINRASSIVIGVIFEAIKKMAFLIITVLEYSCL